MPGTVIEVSATLVASTMRCRGPRWNILLCCSHDRREYNSNTSTLACSSRRKMFTDVAYLALAGQRYQNVAAADGLRFRRYFLVRLEDGGGQVGIFRIDPRSSRGSVTSVG